MKSLVWPVSLAVMSRIGRYLPHGVAVLARVAGRYEPCWPLFAAWRGCPGPCRWSRPGRPRLPLGGHACLCGLPGSLAPREHRARIFFCRRTQGACPNWVSRCGAGASPSVLLPEAPGLRGGCWSFLWILYLSVMIVSPVCTSSAMVLPVGVRRRTCVEVRRSQVGRWAPPRRSAWGPATQFLRLLDSGTSTTPASRQDSGGVVRPDCHPLREDSVPGHGARGHGVPDRQVSGGQAEAEDTSLTRDAACPAPRHQAVGSVRECPVPVVSGLAHRPIDGQPSRPAGSEAAQPGLLGGDRSVREEPRVEDLRNGKDDPLVGVRAAAEACP